MNNPAEGRNRFAEVKEVQLTPESLCGSYYMVWENGEKVDQGLIVGEPQPGVYLLAPVNGLGHPLGPQRVVSLERMMDSTEGEWETRWRFYDTDSWLNVVGSYTVEKEEA